MLGNANMMDITAPVVLVAHVLAAGAHISLDRQGCIVVEDRCLLEPLLEPHESEPLEGVEVQAVGG